MADISKKDKVGETWPRPMFWDAVSSTSVFHNFAVSKDELNYSSLKQNHFPLFK